jgi:signal transduction histidine kinase
VIRVQGFFATVVAVSTAKTEGASTAPAPRRAQASASLGEARIRQIRFAVMAFIGATTTLVGAAILATTGAEQSWDRLFGLVFIGIAAGCFATCSLTRTRYVRASELLLLATAFAGSAGVIIAGKQDTGLLAGLAGLAVVVQTPGIAIRSRGNNYWHVVTAFAVYIVAVLVRLWLRDDGATAQFGEVALKLLVPPTAFGLVWLMARALNQRLMEALEESERSRSALAVSNQLLELANRSLETARVEAERARDGAEAANRAKSMFLANMSHELRTPLNSVIGYTEMIIEDARDAPDRPVKELLPDLRNVVLSAKHLLGLIGGILDLSKIEAGRMELVQEKFSLGEFVREVEQTILPAVRRRNNQLVVRLEEDPGSVVADRGKLKQVLLNLLGNAAKFTSDGEIHLAARRDRDTSTLVFEVRDTGIGIEADKLGLIFEKFTQIDASSTRRYEGAGLGLAITRELCAMMGAAIDVTSKIGTGTTFTVTLPVHPSNETAVAAA